jgi:NADH:ubiquinone oxidoreductase subunit E
LLKTSKFKKIKKIFQKKQTKQSRAILLAILAYVQTGFKASFHALDVFIELPQVAKSFK